MAGVPVSSQLKEILIKLNAIEATVKNIETKLANLETSTAKLEESDLMKQRGIKTMNQRLDTLKEKFSGSPTAPVLKVQLDEFNLQLQNLTKKQEEIALVQEQLKTKDLYLEVYSRWENIKFANIPDAKGAEDTEELVCDFLEREHGFLEARSIEIQRVHHLGKKIGTKPRAILAKFLRAKD